MIEKMKIARISYPLESPYRIKVEEIFTCEKITIDEVYDKRSNIVFRTPKFENREELEISFIRIEEVPVRNPFHRYSELKVSDIDVDFFILDIYGEEEKTFEITPRRFAVVEGCQEYISHKPIFYKGKISLLVEKLFILKENDEEKIKDIIYSGEGFFLIKYLESEPLLAQFSRMRKIYLGKRTFIVDEKSKKYVWENPLFVINFYDEILLVKEIEDIKVYYLVNPDFTLTLKKVEIGNEIFEDKIPESIKEFIETYEIVEKI